MSDETNRVEFSSMDLAKLWADLMALLDIHLLRQNVPIPMWEAYSEITKKQICAMIEGVFSGKITIEMVDKGFAGSNLERIGQLASFSAIKMVISCLSSHANSTVTRVLVPKDATCEDYEKIRSEHSSQ